VFYFTCDRSLTDGRTATAAEKSRRRMTKTSIGNVLDMEIVLMYVRRLSGCHRYRRRRRWLFQTAKTKPFAGRRALCPALHLRTSFEFRRLWNPDGVGQRRPSQKWGDRAPDGPLRRHHSSSWSSEASSKGTRNPLAGFVSEQIDRTPCAAGCDWTTAGGAILV